jgi:hypothetical protein
MKSKRSSWKQRLIPLVLAMSLLTGCAGAGFSSCPPLVEYSKQQQVQLADELTQLPLGSMTERFLLDYGTLREQLRACQ